MLQPNERSIELLTEFYTVGPTAGQNQTHRQ